jgi:hypothetical protein
MPTFGKTNVKPVRIGAFDKQTVGGSAFSDIVETQKTTGFMLRAPKPYDPDYVKCTIYFFNTDNRLEIEVSYKELVKNVIRHLITVFEHSDIAKNLPPIPKGAEWENYELRLIDDYESEYTPDMDMPARPVNEEFGEIESLAFIEKKKKNIAKPLA